VGLIGWPVDHSLSPAMHNAAFAALGLDWRYELLPTPPDRVAATLARLRAEGFCGINVTVPHKQAVMPHLVGVSDVAKAVGAVNTLIERGGRWIGHNTDVDGFLAALCQAGFEPQGRRALLLGAGGAAQAVAYGLTRSGCTVVVHNRTEQRAEHLADRLRKVDLTVHVTPDLARLDLGRFDLLVNATSVGMWPRTSASPWPETEPLPPHWTVYDLVYNPAETRLLAQARAARATAVGGLGMLIHQGALAFELWTGEQAPLDVMRNAAQQALVTHSSMR
jgi:shikimate dehydrogenase